MRGSYNIIWSLEAKDGLFEILKYLNHTFSEEVEREFIQSFEKQIYQVEINPFQFVEISRSRKVRRALVNQLTAIYFRISDNQIQLLAIQDTRKKTKTL